MVTVVLPKPASHGAGRVSHGKQILLKCAGECGLHGELGSLMRVTDPILEARSWWGDLAYSFRLGQSLSAQHYQCI